MHAKRLSMIEREVDGVPVIMTEFGYKTFSMVVKSLGWFTHRTSPTYLRTSGVMETKFGQPEVTEEYPISSANHIIDLYKNAGVNDYKTVVIGPGLEICCYIGAALNAPVLPSQFIASAPDCEFLESRCSNKNLYIIGHEADWPNLCVWVKPINLGELYASMIEQADNVILVSMNSGDANQHGTPRDLRNKNLNVISRAEGGQHFSNLIGDAEARGFEEINDKIPHWEFAMEYEQIICLETYCKERGKRTVMISSGDWIGFIPTLLYKQLYEKNGLAATGITFNNYWCCHPFYEAEFLRIPVTAFEYGADVYVEEFRKVIESIEFMDRNGEYMVWTEEYNRTRAMNPAARFESWGFPTRYRTDRPYDIWHWGWQDEPDLQNPTREWIVPQLIGKRKFRHFSKFVTVDELINICRSVRKVNVTVYDNKKKLENVDS